MVRQRGDVLALPSWSHQDGGYMYARVDDLGVMYRIRPVNSTHIGQYVSMQARKKFRWEVSRETLEVSRGKIPDAFIGWFKNVEAAKRAAGHDATALRGNMNRNPSLILAGNPPVRSLSQHVSDYASAEAFLGGKYEKKLANNTVIFRGSDVTKEIIVKLYATNIVTYYPDGSIVLRSGGHRTVTTKQRINQLIAGSGYRVDQKKYDWFVHPGGAEFYDGIVLAGFHHTRTNPSRSGPLARGEIMSNRVYEVRYKHAEDGADYKHDFGAGVKMEAMPDGSIRLYHATLRLWGDF